MHTTATTYHLSTFTDTMHSDWSHLSLLRDTEEQKEEVAYELDARVRSGDYFVTLATDIEQLNQTVSDHNARLALEDIVSELLYLQDNYSITKHTR